MRGLREIVQVEGVAAAAPPLGMRNRAAVRLSVLRVAVQAQAPLEAAPDEAAPVRCAESLPMNRQ